MEKIHFITQGCSANASETEMMQGLLQKAGYEIVASANDADINVVNICTVKGNSNALDAIQNKQQEKKGLIVTGCITRGIIPEIRKIAPDASLITTHNIAQIVDVVEETSNGNVIEAIEKSYTEKICLPRVRRNPVIGITPILNSCNSFCTFCSTKLVKGKLLSYPSDLILRDIQHSLEEGCKEIWITSQDNSAYMLDQSKTSQLASLINQITDLEGDFYVRVGMMNPSDLLPILDDLIQAFQNPKVFKFIHLPLQAGNDDILEKMKRRYTVDEFFLILDEMKRKIKHLTVATDVIAGFPTETDDQFKDSMSAVQRISPDLLHISRFSAREGTLAAKMPQVHGRISKERTRLISDLFEEIAKKRNEEWVGWKGHVLIDEVGKTGTGTMIGRNFAYKPVIVKGEYALGEKIDVEIESGQIYDLRAK